MLLCLKMIHETLCVPFTLTECPLLPTPTNGGVVTTNGNMYGSVARFLCRINFFLHGDAILTCLESKTWNGTVPVCKLKGNITTGLSLWKWVLKYEYGLLVIIANYIMLLTYRLLLLILKIYVYHYFSFIKKYISYVQLVWEIPVHLTANV